MNIGNIMNAMKIAKYSLAFLWISTGIVSAIISPEVGFEILAKAGIVGGLSKVLVYGGSLVDLILGLWILSSKAIRLCYWTQIITIVGYSILLSFMDASFWLHPFGPLTKNVPILVLIWILIQHQSKPQN